MFKGEIVRLPFVTTTSFLHGFNLQIHQQLPFFIQILCPSSQIYAAQPWTAKFSTFFTILTKF